MPTYATTKPHRIQANMAQKSPSKPSRSSKPSPSAEPEGSPLLDLQQGTGAWQGGQVDTVATGHGRLASALCPVSH
jgi:hypothetical protein